MAGPGSQPGYLFLIPWDLDAIGGVSVAVRGLMAGCVAAGRFAPRALVLDWACAQPTYDEQRGVWRLRVPEPIGPVGLLRSALLLFWRFPVAVIRLARLLERERAAVVNVHYPGLSCLAPLLLRVLGLYDGRVLLSFHGQDIAAIRSATGLRRHLWRFVLRRADGLVACSHVLARELLEIEGVASARVTVIANGVDVGSVRQLAAAESMQPPIARPYVICLATFERKKGLDVLIDAFAANAERFGDVDLVLCGRSAGELEATRRQVAARGLTGRVHLLVDVPYAAAIKLLGGARASVLASRKEPFGLVVLESATLGVPVILTSICGVAEVVPHELVDIVPAEDSGALAAALRRVLSIGSDALSRARSLQEFVAENLTWQAAANRYAALVA